MRQLTKAICILWLGLGVGASATSGQYRQEPARQSGADRAPGHPVAALARLRTRPVPPAQPLPWTKGDLSVIQRRGILRVLAQERHEVHYANRSSDNHAQLVRRFARRHGLQPLWIFVHGEQALVRGLAEGLGDVVVDARHGELSSPQVAPTVALGTRRLVFIARADDRRFDRADDLTGRRAAYLAEEVPEAGLARIRRDHPGLILQPSHHASPGELLAGLRAAAFDLAVLDGATAEPLVKGRSDLFVRFPAGAAQAIAWYTRRDNEHLRDALNGFLNQHGVGSLGESRFSADLQGLKQRGVLRVITRQDPGNWEMGPAGMSGFEHALLANFAGEQGLSLQILLSKDDQQMLDLLTDGRGDLIAAQLPHRQWRRHGNVERSAPFRTVAPALVARRGHPKVGSVAELFAKPLSLQGASDQGNFVRNLVASGLPLDVRTEPQDATLETLLASVARGQTEYAVVDARMDAYLVDGRRDIGIVYRFGQRDKHWLVRGDNPGLRRALDAFIGKLPGSRRYAVAYRKHFSERALDPDRSRYAEIDWQGLSPFDALVRPSASRYGFDWRLIVAQMYQESRFDPQARSGRGAVGLMQVLPRTARELGVEDLRDPRSAIEAGVAYLHSLRERFEPSLPVQQRTWFALAAYNAGYRRVQRARRAAAREGRDPDRWFGHVESIIPSRETVNYVRRIRRLFDHYKQLAREDIIASLTVPGHTVPQRRAAAES